MGCGVKARAAALAAVAVAIPAKAEAHVHGCTTRECDHRIHLKRRAHWKRTHPWQYRWHHLSASDRAWLRSTAMCESHNNPHTNTGNGFYGLTQFTLTTARAAGFRVRPDLAGWYEQAVRSVWWMHRAGTGQWPVCGR